jgi:hypothetical protein
MALFKYQIAIAAGADPYIYTGDPSVEYNWFRVFKMVGQTVTVEFGQGVQLLINKSTLIRIPKFTTFQITNSGSDDAIVNFVIGTDDIYYDHEHEMPISAKLISVPDVVIPAMTQMQVVSASPSALAVTLSSTAAVANAVRWGDSQAGPGRGACLFGLASVRIPGNMDVYIYNPSAVPVTICQTQES